MVDTLMFRSIVLVALLLAVPAGAAEPSDPLILHGLDGRPIAPLDADVRATVFLFTRTDCPISNRYAPEVGRLHDRFRPDGVAFWLVYLDPDESAEAIRRHIEEHGYRFGALRDSAHELVRRTGARVTPEAAVFDAAGTLVYRGRIDDRYVAFGRSREKPKTRDLKKALEAVLDGRPVREPTTRAIGCYIADLE